MRFTTLTIMAGLAAFALLVVLPFRGFAGDGDQNRVRLEVRLTATDAAPGASGSARFEMRQDRRELRVEVEDVVSTDAADVFVNGDFIGAIVLNGGRGQLELNSRNGDQVAILQDGDEIEIVDATDDATLLLFGTLSPHN